MNRHPRKNEDALKKSDLNVLITKLQRLEDNLRDNLLISSLDKDEMNPMALFVQSLHDIEASDPEAFALLSFS